MKISSKDTITYSKHLGPFTHLHLLRPTAKLQRSSVDSLQNLQRNMKKYIYCPPLAYFNAVTLLPQFLKGCCCKQPKFFRRKNAILKTVE